MDAAVDGGDYVTTEELMEVLEGFGGAMAYVHEFTLR
jgi:hypothetical protein